MLDGISPNAISPSLYILNSLTFLLSGANWIQYAPLGSVDDDAKIKFTNPFVNAMSVSIVDFSLTIASSDI